ncbi:hypothetical protein [Pleionea sediminis]|uniref:hypothetical protein n=1 Tax=Pleionea sediminis TaxID=2569479 RepID=UPI0011865E54|nr:hypothetical protein [Pleionea sediminis]
MFNYDSKLIQILKALGENWIIQDYQLAGMGWVAVISSDAVKFSLHSERGWVDIYFGKYQDQNKLGCKSKVEDIVHIIVKNVT